MSPAAGAADGPRVDVAAVLKDIGRRVAELRAAKGFTQAQLAEALGLDVTHLQKIEGGKLNVTVRTLCMLADGLGCASAQELLAPPAPGEPRRPRKRRGGPDGA